MTQEEAIANQNRIAQHYKLGWWYGVRCTKCHGVYPKLEVSDALGGGCWYQCEVCGKRTGEKSMPWLAEKAWNNNEFVLGQIRMF